MKAEHLVLCINSGSSSLKYGLWRVGVEERKLASGSVREIAQVFEALAELPRPSAVGHRIVHGGMDHVVPELVNAHTLRALRELVPFAPLHLPPELAALEATQQRYGDLPQVVCFDTAFHREMPEVARRLPLPRALWEQGVRRYGFHGLSYEYIVAALADHGRGRLLIAHLGSGASMAAVLDGRPVDTTMGLTPCGGLVMATRSGDLDPGVLLHLLRTGAYDVSGLERMLEYESGLRGLSGTSANMEELLVARQRDAAAAQAVDAFTYSVRRQIGALAAVLGGLDTLVFTGGIGQNAAAVRAQVCQGLDHLGLSLDAAANEAHADVISRPGGACTVRVMATNEELMIARHTASLLPLAQG